jgi:hypothetical protein
MRWTTPWLAVALLALACGDEKPPPAPKQPPPKKAVDKSAWKEIETPVPRGTKIPCAKLLPQDKVQAALAKPYAIVDDSARDSEATSVCRLVQTDKKGKLGDELCMVSVYCWSVWNVGDIKKKCDAGNESSSTEDGVFTCVRTVPAGDKERHVITVLEPDTRCKVVVNAGPSVFDLNATRSCAKTVVSLIDQASIKP